LSGAKVFFHDTVHLPPDELNTPFSPVSGKISAALRQAAERLPQGIAFGVVSKK
jgi:hypothetical protein